MLGRIGLYGNRFSRFLTDGSGQRHKIDKDFLNYHKKELSFLEPIKPEMSVDDIFNNLMRVFKEKGIKVYPDTQPDKGDK